ncbi:tRNA (adenosine(37)-N6)-dimethylallyltransferase MiaA [Thalassobacillus sp. CUG 92003]|uniref:tRNA (adenosine(37)-N6)-dimethylallyltransferase MiaA n=1 Tax=Thalassobacillus sp. CUG 92003 TaxID=2736641 RepID=UPI0015E709A8|nr:tRNA (adenosine(37)-N6)-dimethylallyltransferase MiaA [Thalassobacillus sp. CUG 92003]
MKSKVIAVVGPTAVGKSALGVLIAKQMNGEIISGDSMQIYRTMDIGTAKIAQEEAEGIPHHLLDIKDPDEPFSVAEFKERVQLLIDDITNRGKLPIIVGGTGLYIQSVLYDFQFSDQGRDKAVSERLAALLEREGPQSLHERLNKIDPVQAEKIHPNNTRRVIRALEVFETTGMTMTDFHNRQVEEQPYDHVLVGLEMDRDVLYQRINERVDYMVEQGLLQEVSRLYWNGYRDAPAMKAIGYKEFIPYLEGVYDFDYAVALLKRNSRRYAKRQYTYFKNKFDIQWYTIAPSDYQEKFETILSDLAGMRN